MPSNKQKAVHNKLKKVMKRAKAEYKKHPEKNWKTIVREEWAKEKKT